MHDKSKSTRAEILEAKVPPAEKVAHYFDRLEAFMIESEFRGCPYSNTGAVSDAGRTGILERIREHKESIREFFHRISEEKFDDPQEANSIGDRIFLLHSGATVESQNLKEIWPIREAKAGAVTWLR